MDRHEAVRAIMADDAEPLTDDNVEDLAAIVRLIVDVPHESGHYLIVEMPESASTVNDLWVLREKEFGGYARLEYITAGDRELPADTLTRAFTVVAMHIRFAMH